MEIPVPTILPACLPVLVSAQTVLAVCETTTAHLEPSIGDRTV